MKQIVCEMCNSTDFLKEDGMFVCQGCGMKYSVAEAKNLMVEVEGDAPKASSANNDKIANMLTLAQNAIEQGNNSQAEDYANKILELNNAEPQAWLIKGEAIGWQSTTDNIRFSEMASCFSFALKYAEGETKENYKKIMADQCASLINALINLTTKNFGEYPSDENLQRINKAVQGLFSLRLDMLKMFVFIDAANVETNAAQKINSAAVNGSNKADADFGTDNSMKTKYAWNLWLGRYDNCITLLDSALAFCPTESLAETIRKNYEILMNNTISSCSYRFEANGYWSGYVQDYSLTADAKAIRRKKITTFNTNVAEKKKKIKEEAEKKAKEEQKKRNDAYWEKNAELKKRLEAEKAELQEKVAPLKKQIKEIQDKNAPETKQLYAQLKEAVPGDADVAAQKKVIAELQGKRASLGLFKGKEKKAIDAQVTDVEQPKLKQLTAAADAQRKERDDKLHARLEELDNETKDLSAEVTKAEARIKEIDTLLTKNY